MSSPYEECATCPATKWCKLYSGEVQKSNRNWCRANYRLRRAIRLSEVPFEYHEANRYNYKVDKHNEMYFEGLKPYLDDIVRHVGDGANFFLFGDKPGTGKSYHASMLLNQYIYKTCLTEQFDFESPLALFVVYSDFMEELRYSRTDEQTQRRMEMVRNVPLLLLDDVGAGKVNDTSNEYTYSLLNYRFNNRLSTIITSNHMIDQLKKLIGSRSVSRILNRCYGIEIGGRDRRMDSTRRVIG